MGIAAFEDRSSVGEVALAVLRRQLVELLAHEPGARLGEGAEEIHDMRVAIRRMRAAMALFGDALPESARPLRRELKWVARTLGEVRDVDVQLRQVASWARELPAEDRAALDPVMKSLRNRRTLARRRLLRALDSARYGHLVASLTTMIEQPPSGTSVSRIPVALAGPRLVRRRYRTLRKAAAAVGKRSPPQDLHRLRIRGKRLRYAIEFLQPVYGKPAVRLIARLKAVQDVLGLHQDAQVAMEHFRQMAVDQSHALPSDAQFLLGRLAERYRMQAQEQRALVPKVYGRVRGKAWKRLRGAMDERASGVEAETAPNVVALVNRPA